MTFYHSILSNIKKKDTCLVSVLIGQVLMVIKLKRTKRVIRRVRLREIKVRKRGMLWEKRRKVG